MDLEVDAELVLHDAVQRTPVRLLNIFFRTFHILFYLVLGRNTNQV